MSKSTRKACAAEAIASPNATSHHPDSDRPARAPRSRYVRSTQGIALQSAREQAEMSHEDVAHRVILTWRVLLVREPFKGVPYELKGQDLRTLPSLTRECARLERASQDSCDRASEFWDAFHADRARGESPDHGKGWRPDPVKFEMYTDAIALGHGSATVEELQDAYDGHRREERERARDRALRRLRSKGEALARLVWNQAEDPKFLDQALAAELHDLYVLDDGGSYFVRATLCALAHELRVSFPGRSMIQADDGLAA